MCTYAGDRFRANDRGGSERVPPGAPGALMIIRWIERRYRSSLLNGDQQAPTRRGESACCLALRETGCPAAGRLHLAVIQVKEAVHERALHARSLLEFGGAVAAVTLGQRPSHFVWRGVTTYVKWIALGIAMFLAYLGRSSRSGALTGRAGSWHSSTVLCCSWPRWGEPDRRRAD
jgi:hypothetical protein